MSGRHSVAFGKLARGPEAPTPADRLDALHKVAEIARGVRTAFSQAAGPRTARLEELSAALDELDRIEAGCRGGGA